MSEYSFEQFSAMVDRETLEQSSKYVRRALPEGVYRTLPPLTPEFITGKDGTAYVKFRGQGTAPDGTTVTLSLFLNPNVKADGKLDQMFSRAWKDIEEATGTELKTAGAVLDFIGTYPVDVHLRKYTNKKGEEENGITSIKAVRA